LGISIGYLGCAFVAAFVVHGVIKKHREELARHGIVGKGTVQPDPRASQTVSLNRPKH
jgi:hypothetical protein